MTQWASFEAGWKRFQAANEAYTAPIFSGGSYVSAERFSPSQERLAHGEMDTETWIRTINDIEQKYRGRV